MRYFKGRMAKAHKVDHLPPTAAFAKYFSFSIPEHAP